MLKKKGGGGAKWQRNHEITHVWSHVYCLYCIILEREGRWDIVY